MELFNAHFRCLLNRRFWLWTHQCVQFSLYTVHIVIWIKCLHSMLVCVYVPCAVCNMNLFNLQRTDKIKVKTKWNCTIPTTNFDWWECCWSKSGWCIDHIRYEMVDFQTKPNTCSQTAIPLNIKIPFLNISVDVMHTFCAVSQIWKWECEQT